MQDDAKAADRSGTATRAALRRAAVAVIAERGWQAAGARAVTTRAGVPLGAINYHYAGKEALLRDAALAEIGAMFATPARIIDSAVELEDLIDRLLTWSGGDDVTDVQRALLLEVMAQSRRDPGLARLLSGALAGYRSAVAAAFARLARGGGDVVSGRMAARADAFAAHCDGLWLHSVIDPDFGSAAAGQAATQVWIRGLDTEPDAAVGAG